MMIGRGQTDSARSQSIVLATDDPLGERMLAPTTGTIPYIRGSLGGNPLTTDPDPNFIDPGEPGGEKAVFRIQPARGAPTIGSGSYIGTVGEMAGSLTQQSWIYDDVRKRWFKLGAAAAVSVFSTILTWGAAMVGAKVFIQITANGSSITQLWIIAR